MISLTQLVLYIFLLVIAIAQDQFVIQTDENIQSGSCGEAADFSDESQVICAMGTEDFGGEFDTEMCGKCLKVTDADTGKSVECEVVSKCGKRCVPGTIQLSIAAGEEINPEGPDENGTFAVEWEIVDCGSADDDDDDDDEA